MSVFCIFFIHYNNKSSASPRRERLGKFCAALLHVFEFGYKTPHRCRAESTKWFDLASRSKSSI